MPNEKKLLKRASSKEGKRLKKSRDLDKKLTKLVMGDKPGR